MQFLLSLLAVAATAAVGENVVFTRALGDGGLPYQTFRPRQALFNAVLMTAASMLAALAGWLCELLLDRVLPIASYMRPPVYLLIYCLFFAAIDTAMSRSAGMKSIRKMSAVVTFGYIPISTMLFVGFGSYGIAEALVYGLSVGVGYLGAMLLVWVLRERCLFSEVPRAFKGLPISLIYMGLVSLALFGLLGHQPAI